jgi:hypothetical protein
MKKCPKCGNLKEFIDFNTNCSRVDGHSDWCKICNRINSKTRKDANRPKVRKDAQLYHSKNKENINKKHREHYITVKEERLEYQKIYRKTHKEQVNENRRRYAKIYIPNRLKTDINFRIATNIRARMRSIFKKESKKGKTLELLGCSVIELKKFLETKFYINPITGETMSWDNYGIDGWEIDHIKPIASFDLREIDQQKEAFNYNNLQPLWEQDHVKKSKKDIKLIVALKKKV